MPGTDTTLTQEDVYSKLLEILEEFEVNPEKLKIEDILRGRTLEELKIGVFPIGNAEILNLIDRVEKVFRIQFTHEEITGVPNPEKLTVEQVAEAIWKKLKRQELAA